MKKYIAITMAILMLFTLSSSVIAETGADEIKVTLDGNTIDFPDVKPYIDNSNRTLVPIRFVSEAMGADVSWDGDARIVTIAKDKDKIVYKIGSLKATLNDSTMVFDSVGVIKEGRTMVPLRFIAELMNCKVEWVDAEKTVTITSPPPPVPFPEPKITLHFSEGTWDNRAMWITLDNLLDFKDCTNYQFKIEFTDPEQLNTIEQDEGAVLGWQTYAQNQWRQIYVSAPILYTMNKKNYTTRANKETFKLVDGMPLKFTLSVKRMCSGKIKEYSYNEIFKYPYPAK